MQQCAGGGVAEGAEPTPKCLGLKPDHSKVPAHGQTLHSSQSVITLQWHHSDNKWCHPKMKAWAYAYVRVSHCPWNIRTWTVLWPTLYCTYVATNTPNSMYTIQPILLSLLQSTCHSKACGYVNDLQDWEGVDFIQPVSMFRHDFMRSRCARTFNTFTGPSTSACCSVRLHHSINSINAISLQSQDCRNMRYSTGWCNDLGPTARGALQRQTQT